MADRSDEWGWLSWLGKWERRGELAVTLGITAGATWLAAALPSQHTTHVDIWPPLVVFAVVAVVGIYVLVAVEKRWWLPGRAGALSEAHTRATWGLLTKIQEKADAGGDVRALERIADALDELIERLPPRTEEEQP